MLLECCCSKTKEGFGVLKFKIDWAFGANVAVIFALCKLQQNVQPSFLSIILKV